MFIKTTNDIKITAMTQFLQDQSSVENEHFVWAYTINIENLGSDKVKLLNRKWNITDSSGQLQVVEGAGVVGEQPVIESGGVFQYTSGIVLSTQSGIMQGSYEMQSIADGKRFWVGIPVFSLDSPYQQTRPN